MDDKEPVRVNLGEMQSYAEKLVSSGRYLSLDHVVQDALQALREDINDHEAWLEDPATIEWMRAKVKESLDDPTPPIPAEEVFERLELKHRKRMKLAGERAA
ncbi:type II toxin-antitoxin system ParD family antitoxin [uncultured Enterovirga sp.]|uniref:ribbon-helix-helix domain-containing protein n=1 Tax=uncultured Enterovirga sp. TaxID=2026352 RepID=UPI0035CC389D